MQTTSVVTVFALVEVEFAPVDRVRTSGRVFRTSGREIRTSQIIFRTSDHKPLID
ncbi:hypothetical protein ACFO0S_05080 [Chryseomicrobium palamuruense]|uniref:Uncharacterized protein n=1 Tax=Chryseomicrobium palamuruense TaxID=682973 RepID=A0ABV8UU51_9BACL